MNTKALSFLNQPGLALFHRVAKMKMTVRRANEATTTINLSHRDAVRMAELIENPSAPSKNYLEAKERHRRMKDAGARVARGAAQTEPQQERV